jgi:hypothetical protein
VREYEIGTKVRAKKELKILSVDFYDNECVITIPESTEGFITSYGFSSMYNYKKMYDVEFSIDGNEIEATIFGDDFPEVLEVLPCVN